MKEITRRTDPQTGELFFPKRANQKFARPENRIKFNNDAANELRKERECINKAIHTAHIKLRKLMTGLNKAEFSFDYMDGAEIEFNAFTHFELYDKILRPAIYEFVLITDKQNKKITIIRYGRL
ncbi:hypothetical protein [Flavobacterium aciduliphilum]|uniref:Uncharacterized protein n=1 Tax=Flavobacterium aciduliphilum TaxID=1101402 RepID=A0A328YNZ1_9FLAO|nr:hypothetical protein [Flavobacterium aciduliphilum]RAR73862.1 hypothetical protein CLV55_103181 [Flavobacterium aciduliphilum]